VRNELSGAGETVDIELENEGRSLQIVAPHQVWVDLADNPEPLSSRRHLAIRTSLHPHLGACTRMQKRIPVVGCDEGER
jgi:hypothetical protein